MKNLFLPFIISCVLLACTNAQTTNQGDSDSDSTSDGKNVSKRDNSITRAVAYSTLFIDSSELGNYISGEKIPANIARRMRSFYNARNYQFAWFSGDGLTEQARGFWNLHDYVTNYQGDSSLKDKALQKTMDNLV